MKTALVCAGGAGQSFLARMPSVLGSLGPLKASSLRVARRISNLLRAGAAVDGYGDLDGCNLIWVVVPEPALDRITRELASGAAIAGTAVVLCATQQDSSWPVWLKDRGAQVATLDVVGAGERTLAAEGHPATLKQLRRVAAAEHRKLIEVHAGAKVSYLAGVRLASDLPMPFFAAAMESLRSSGLSRVEAARLIEELGTRSLRAYGRSGRKAWNPKTTSDLRQSLSVDLVTIYRNDPALAKLYGDGIEQALRYFAEKAASAP